MKEVIPTR